jgi:hypothetical protein
LNHIHTIRFRCSFACSGAALATWLTGSSRDIPGNAQIDPDERKK